MILLSFFITMCYKSENHIFCVPPFLFSSPSSQFSRRGPRWRPRTEPAVLENCHNPIPHVSSLVKRRLVEELPLLYVCVTSQPLARLCSCPAPHDRVDAWRKTTEMLLRSSKWHESWLLFILFHCSSCCVYSWGRLSATVPISQIGHFQFVFRGIDRLSLSLSSVFVDGRSLGWLWWCRWTSSSLGDDKGF